MNSELELRIKNQGFFILNSNSSFEIHHSKFERLHSNVALPFSHRFAQGTGTIMIGVGACRIMSSFRSPTVSSMFRKMASRSFFDA